ncbi:hypothetical protein IC213_19505 [Clostridioides sp. ES-S-0049-02]|uniref:hypothetical protein n=1 Tax=Clostridioides sp. ES-S-0049-02 TaxID=2770778 RepID=UPI001D0FA2E2|nr:hypothetical protein [Clostridioides sp. ES-S-0049-02]
MFLKKLKKSTIIALTGLMLVSSLGNLSFADEKSNELNSKSTLSSFDIESKDEQSFSETRNEYDMVKELRNMGNQKLKTLGYDDNQIKELKNYETNFKKHIEEMNLLSDTELKNLDYSDEQINIIKNFNGSESQIEKAAASVTNTISKNSSSSTASKSKLNVKIRFSWSGVPVMQFTDAYAIVNGEGMYYDNENTLFTTTYTGSGGQKTYKGYLKRAGAGNTGADTKFPVYRNEVVKYYLKSGSANIGMSKSSRVKQCGIGVSYGHASISLGITVTYPASLGISFGSKVTPTYKSNLFTL